ncbi:hypothetical protein NW762_014094 [Fusarium torreyae]|uniref:Uncharacterized protein n=1 Tax=Fusarium torreyae TaxID=1237075 RepID=A0A9W8RKK8_9HYPO|nr:hypothetical protein NW762_014094 [Fusarium torreyae]
MSVAYSEALSLKGKTVVITGGAHGLGLLLADVLAEAGAFIAVLDIGIPKKGFIQALATKHTVQVKYYKTDVINRKEVSDVIEVIFTLPNSFSININSAGVVIEQSFLEADDRNLATTFDVNFRELSSSLSLAQRLCTYAQKITCYTATKAALGGLYRPMAMELAQYGITSNSLSPGSMRTDTFREVEKSFPDLVKQFNQQCMFGRVGNPEELEPAILFLDSTRCTMGQDLLVDGGISSWKHRGNW